MAKARKARKTKKRRRAAEKPVNGPVIKSSARKSRGFEENVAEEVRPDDAEFLH
ncbi:MAG TPA: hypothetical protein VF950_28885 [Planctomycetota bacterium]